ncbi:MAG: MG2 domain-containing protein [bacterium]
MKTAKILALLLLLFTWASAGPECSRDKPATSTVHQAKEEALKNALAPSGKEKSILPVDLNSSAKAEVKKKSKEEEENEFPGTPEFSAQRSPDRIRIKFSQNMVLSEKVKKETGSDTIVWTDPQIKSDLYWEGRKTLVLKPEEPLPFFEGFQVELVRLDTKRGVVRSPEPDAWKASFKLTRLELDDIKVESVDYPGRKVKVLLEFNGKVDRKSLTKKISISVNNEKINDFELSVEEAPGKILLVAPMPRPRLTNKLRVEVKKNVKAEDSGKATSAAYAKTIELKDPKSLSIRDVDVEEGARGYYLEVRCRDYERRHSYKCDVAEDELKNKVSIDPAVEPTFANERRGFKIFGGFEAREYTLKIEKGMVSDHGAILKRDFKKKLEIQKRTPKASFMTKGRYLPGHYLTRIPVRHINVDQVEIRARRVPEKNLVFWMSGRKEDLGDRTSDLIGERTYRVPNRQDEKITSWLDLSALVPRNKKGVFEFTVKGAKSSDSIRVVLTDMTMVAKRFGKEGRDLYTWIMDAESLAPRKNVRVQLVTTSNRTLASAVTDGNGLARFQSVKDPMEQADKKPFAIVAEDGSDLTFLRFQDVEVPLSEYPVQGEPYHSSHPYRAAVYTDRGVYRPGETAHVAAVVWEDDNRAPGEEVPAIGRLKDPRGKEVDSVTSFTNKAGMVSFDYKLQDFAPTGNYEFFLEIGGNTIDVHSFHVEEFVPERMKVKVKPEEKEQLYTEPSVFNVKARYLFGADAKGARTEARCILEESELSFADHPGYTFDVWRPEPLKPVHLDALEKKLDEKGTASITCPPAGSVMSVKGPAKVKAMVSVFESGSGRTTMETGSMKVHPARYYFGLKSSADSVRDGQKVEVKGIVVDWEGEPVKEIDGLTVELVELESDWVYEYDPDLGRSHYHRYRREIPRSSKRVKVRDGRFSYSFSHSGYVEGYLVRARKTGNNRTDLYLSGNRYDWYWSRYYGRGGKRDATPGPQVPEGLAMHVPDHIRVNQPVEVSMNLPYPGRLLFTVETDEVIKHKWMEAEEGKFTADFTLKKFAPNVYVTALLIKDPYHQSKDAFIPGRSYGVRSIKVEPTEHVMDVQVVAPDKVQPNSELEIGLQAAPQQGPVFATVAAVDEGILQLTDFQSPSPLAELFKKRALGVETFETIGWTLLLPPSAKSSITGGDGAGAYDARGSQSRVQAVKPVALWSGLVKLDEEGRADISFQVPTYRGQLRVMAVVAGPGRAGSASTRVLVKDPLVLQHSFPRFLIAKDEFVAPVFLTNTTEDKKSITVELSHGKEIEIDGSAKKSIVLDPGQSGLVTYLGKVNAAYGTASFDIIASAGEIVSTDHVDLPIHLTGGETNEVTFQKVEPGTNDLTHLLDGWMPRYEQTTVTLTSNKYGKELSHLKYLVRYPYGCIEQTTSTMRPLLFISNLVPSIDPQLLKDGSIEDMVMHGIYRILSMQNSDGGFSYWPGRRNSSLWSTTYATHLLMEAIDAGYPVDKKKLDKAVAFLEKKLTYSASPRGSRRNHHRYVNTEPYMHFILAKAGKGRIKRVRNLIDNPPEKEWDRLKTENMFLLKAALYMMGDHTYEHDLRHPSAKMKEGRKNDWTFWSSLRTKGIMLNITEDIMPGNPGTAPLAKNVAENLQRRSFHYTTQDLGWCISGLGRRSAGGAKSWKNPRLYLDGKKIPPAEKAKDENKATGWSIKGASGADKLALSVDSISGGDLYALVRVEGIKPGASVQTGDHSIKAERTYRHESGKPLSMDEIEVGELVFVELTLINRGRQTIENVALVDRFAAGFEIENPRLGRKHVAKWFDAKKLWNTDYMNMRDSRIEFFGKLGSRKEVKLVYAMRAVTGGRFYTPPVRAEAMYKPSIWSQKAGETAVISDPWGVIIN